MKSRRERREEARANKTAFEPQYNGRVLTKELFDKEKAKHKARLKQLAETGLVK